MNRQYLLDSLDGLKALVFRLLPAEVAGSIACVPMTTDGPWTDAERTVFETAIGIPGQRTFWTLNPRDAAALDDLDAITTSQYFVMLYPKRTASSFLFEAGCALALGKKCLYLVRDRSHLPFLMQQAKQAFDFVKLYEYESLTDIQKILSNRRCFEF